MVAGAVDRVSANRLDFTYARSYLDNERAISFATAIWSMPMCVTLTKACKPTPRVAGTAASRLARAPSARDTDARNESKSAADAPSAAVVGRTRPNLSRASSRDSVTATNAIHGTNTNKQETMGPLRSEAIRPVISHEAWWHLTARAVRTSAEPRT